MAFRQYGPLWNCPQTTQIKTYSYPDKINHLLRRTTQGLRRLPHPPYRARMLDSKIILEAIALKRCIDVTYNRMRMKLAPHILYTRHDDLFTDAVTIEREGRAFTEIKLGTFKLAGLKDGAVTGQTFLPQPSVFNPEDPKYAGTTLLAVEG